MRNCVSTPPSPDVRNASSGALGRQRTVAQSGARGTCPLYSTVQRTVNQISLQYEITRLCFRLHTKRRESMRISYFLHMLSLRLYLTFLAGATVAAAQPYIYVSNEMGNNVAVVNVATNTVTGTIPISGAGLTGLAVTPDGAYLYVTEQSTNSVAIISTSTNSVAASVAVGSGPVEVAITPDG